MARPEGDSQPLSGGVAEVMLFVFASRATMLFFIFNIGEDVALAVRLWKLRLARQGNGCGNGVQMLCR